MNNFNAFYGMDVHQNTISIARAEPGKAIQFLCTIDNIPEKISAFFKAQLEKFKMIKTAYESGSCGTVLHKQLVEMGIHSEIIAPTRIPKRQKKKKNDRLDAMSLAEFLINNQLTPIYIHCAEDEIVREKTRQRESFQNDLKQAKNKMLSFLRRNGIRYTRGKSYWTKTFIDWLGSIQFSSPELQIIFSDYLVIVYEKMKKIKEIDEQIFTMKEAWQRKPVVDAVMSLKGCGLICAASIVAEIGSFARFETAGHFMGYLGLVPSEFSSGKAVTQGRITKEGNGRVRRLLVEAAQSYRKFPRFGVDLTKRLRNLPIEYRNYSFKAQVRLHKRYWRLINANKKHNVAIVAIARELAGFLWAIACEAESSVSQYPLQETA